jgi:Tfp pilus assembly protein PilE
VAGLVALVLGIISLVKISKNNETLKGRGLAITGIVLGAISVVTIPIIALLTAIAIPNLLRARLAANEAYAQAKVQTIAVATESYAMANDGEYPFGIYSLTSTNPPYIAESFRKGYKYSLNIDADGQGYTITAEPDNCGTSGTKIFTQDSRGSLQEEDCLMQSD